MTGEHVDPAYKYCDDKIRPLKRELERLKDAHDKLATENAAALLQLQRFVAVLRVNADADSFADMIANQLHDSTTTTQLFADAAAIKEQMRTSSKPFELCLEFSKRWARKLQESGVKFVTY